MKIILDINTIPSDYKEGKSTKEIVDAYKESFGVDIVPIDLAKENVQDGFVSKPIILPKDE